jgi:hypothetical protein
MSRDGILSPHGYAMIIGVLEVQGRELFVYSVMDGHSSSLSEQMTKDRMGKVVVWMGQSFAAIGKKHLAIFGRQM